MRLKLLALLVINIFVFTACQQKEEQKPETTINPNSHKVTVEEVIQVSGYTY